MINRLTRASLVLGAVFVISAAVAGGTSAATITLPNGDRATAPVRNHYLNGPGAYTFADGLRLYGKFHRGSLRGPVRYGSPSGPRYRGSVARDGIFYNFTGPVDAEGRPNGYGVCRYGSDTLRGTWQHGKLAGRVTDVLHDGTRLVVEVSPPSEVLRGTATVVLPNGDREYGHANRDGLEGAGTYLDSFTGNRITGTFVHGVLQGQATLYTPQGETFSGVEKDGVFYQ